MNTESIPPPSDARPTTKEQALALLERLVETYPTAFRPFGEREIRPLKLGIHKDLMPAIREWGFSAAALKYAMGMYTRQLRYQFALLKSDGRIDLQGEAAGEISEAHRQTARAKVDLITAKRKQSRESRSPNDQPKGRPKGGRRPQKPRPAVPEVNENAVAALQQKLNRKASV